MCTLDWVLNTPCKLLNKVLTRITRCTAVPIQKEPTIPPSRIQYSLQFNFHSSSGLPLFLEFCDGIVAAAAIHVETLGKMQNKIQVFQVLHSFSDYRNTIAESHQYSVLPVQLPLWLEPAMSCICICIH